MELSVMNLGQPSEPTAVLGRKIVLLLVARDGDTYMYIVLCYSLERFYINSKQPLGRMILLLLVARDRHCRYLYCTYFGILRKYST